ncbi:ABC transporter, permease protein [Paenibacillus larvae subsp. larvae]|uniref:ABC transporter, permease protein n=3 Tax=Paenibacillus larvae TaxID=1464 RepID=V9WCJ3_9BACL|nr:sugar ABC transporter permease [Paenibacillus larvae]AHD06827.1 ABC transporter, permease protein [Paenibacillus larvae subsp. larvae DSM 25430]AQT84340.1 sugar ABC transporter permease [Paenibacillus larvae subsp. pulvifaciens]AQZ46327.1 sugar ABC transporter permease [Paenibacillus larvae subsp. pulvifaciens]ARF67660.1 sugar ABC transporter permease [Paenibacillus larvae subsp. pulvifaciens]AVF28011.1 ABC transporter, permease protein [Paenibacillus larvae subsp. larvae]
MPTFLKKLNKNKVLLFMILPGALWFLIFSYLPILGTVIAFKDYKIHRDGFFASVFNSEWVGLDNFKFLFATDDAWVITRNTLVYNFIFIIVGLICTVGLAIALSELINKKLAKVYQTGMFMPYFLSWVIIGYFTFSFLSVDKGVINQIIIWFGGDPVQWYSESKWWPYILTFMNLWKGTGYGSVVYLAAIVGIDKSYYEAAMIDGASKWQQIKHITLPAIKPLMIMLTILAVGRIFYADFGLFYQIPRDSGALYSVTNVIDTYVYRGMTAMGELGMSTAVGLYQSIIGFILVISSNWVIRKIDKDNAIF